MYASRSNIEELFVMGHRLMVFFSKAIPKHPEYHSTIPIVVSKRTKSRRDLDWIKKRLDVVALRIDEKQLNQYILKDLGIPQPDLQQQCKTHNQENSCQDHQTNLVHSSWEQEEQESSYNQEPWESFDGTNTWSVCTTSDFLDLDWESAHDISFETDDMEQSPDVIAFPRTHSATGCYTDRAAGSVTYTIAEALYRPTNTTQETDDESDSDEVDSWAQESVESYKPHQQQLQLQQQQLQHLQWSPRTNRHVLADIRNEFELSANSMMERSDLLRKTSAVSQYHGSAVTLDVSHYAPELSMSRTIPEKENNQRCCIDTTEKRISPYRRVRFDEGQNQLQLFVPNDNFEGITTKQTSCDVPYHRMMSVKGLG